MSQAKADEWLHSDKGKPWDPISRAKASVAAIGKRAEESKRKTLAFGGIADPYYAREEAAQERTRPYGFVATGVPGRTDRHDVDVPDGSYVLPAEVVSGLGEGNSLAGAKVAEMMFRTGPFGVPNPPLRRGAGPPRPPSAFEPAQPHAKGGRTERAPQKGDADAPEGFGHLHFGEKHAHPLVPVTVAGGEVIMPPWVVAYHPMLGGLNPNDHNPAHYKRALKHGHEVLDDFTRNQLKEHAATIAALPGPVK